MRKIELHQEYFSTTQAASLLKLSRIAVFKKIKSGLIPAKKIGRNFAIPKESIEALLGSHLTHAQEAEIKIAVKRAVKEYRKTFDKLAKE